MIGGFPHPQSIKTSKTANLTSNLTSVTLEMSSRSTLSIYPGRYAHYTCKALISDTLSMAEAFEYNMMQKTP